MSRRATIASLTTTPIFVKPGGSGWQEYVEGGSRPVGMFRMGEIERAWLKGYMAEKFGEGKH